MVALENMSDSIIDAILWKCYRNPDTYMLSHFWFSNDTFKFETQTTSQSLLFNAFSLTYIKAHKMFYYTAKTCRSLILSQKQRSTYHRMIGLCPVFHSCLLAYHVFWQPAPIFLSLPLSVALEPNYSPRTQRSNHKARSHSTVHHAHYTGL